MLTCQCRAMNRHSHTHTHKNIGIHTINITVKMLFPYINTLSAHTHTLLNLFFLTHNPPPHTHTHTSYKNISLKEKSCVTFSFSTHSTCKTHVTHTIKSHVYISCRTSIKLSGCSKLQFITDNYRVIIG